MKTFREKSFMSFNFNRENDKYMSQIVYMTELLEKTQEWQAEKIETLTKLHK